MSADDHGFAEKNIVTLPQYLEELNVEKDLASTLCQAASACIEISAKLKTLPITSYLEDDVREGDTNVQGEIQKPMDVVANEIFVNTLENHVAALASEEEEDIMFPFLPVRSGIGDYEKEHAFSKSGRNLLAAGYTVYSSSLELVISVTKEDGELIASGFTLADDQFLQRHSEWEENSGIDANKFILSRPNMKCPESGSYYSLNDGREPDWPLGLQKWIHDAKRGQTPSTTVYSSRYVCSLCADVHRTFIKGGWAGNPRPHLRLLYEAAPLAHIAEACGGRGSDGVRNLLDITPKALHDRTSVFIGSRNDIRELESYGDVQQCKKTYKV
ncbi:hypothetical protein CTEN210_01353 [Chaetoceros tenuissimus]|uniref:Fructose-1-6-bisphosphatase class 1 C-terminal domain-containing protein n=1 Tax=Chaetoceros tenuissimus TaxID=426638 RepID=A0AAD3CHA7_9STRA|nr:hypothetical protein CTEN210_01353 [Chaetoceros tenuissimus]